MSPDDPRYLDYYTAEGKLRYPGATDHDRALALLKDRGLRGIISEDFEFHVMGRNGKPMSHQTGTSLFNKLWKMKIIVPSGERRRTRAGGVAQVHVLKELLGAKSGQLSLFA